MRALILLPLLVSACDPWSRWPNESSYEVDRLWDDDVIAADGGLYVSLPQAGALVFVPSAGGEAAEVDLGGAEPVRLTLAPDQRSLLVTSRWSVCDDDDPDIETLGDCPEDELRSVYALDLVVDGALAQSFDIPPYLNAFSFTHGGTKALAYVDAESYATLDELEDQALVDLNAVAVLDLEARSAEVVSVGFAANNFLFNEDDSLALVLAQSQAIVLDLGTLDVNVRYNLTLDEDEELDARAADFTPDGRYALIAISGSRDLYKLDLEIESIDILSMDGVPSDLYVDSATDQTAVVYAGQAQVDVIDHDASFLVESVELETPVTEITALETGVLLYNDANDGVKYLYRLDMEDLELTPYVVTNPVNEVMISDSGRYALAVLRPTQSWGGSSADDYTASHYGLGVLTLDDDDALSVTLTGTPVGVALVDAADTTYALVLVEGEEELLMLDLASPSMLETVAMPAPATGIGTMPDGRFWITHDEELGMVSFLEPETRALESVGGFAAFGLIPDDSLPEREEM